jgi:transcription termination/antitermination protein NusG
MLDDKDKRDEDEDLDADHATEEAADQEPASADQDEDQPEAADLPDDLPDDESLFFDLPDEAPDAAKGADAAAEPDTGELDLDALAAETGGDLTEQDLLAAIDLQISAEDKAEIERKSRLEWFTLHANTGHENKVKRNIEMAIKSNHMEESFGDVLVPIQEVTEMKNGKRVTTKRKFLPGYLLIEMLMNKETHHFINSIPGVTGFIGGTPLKPQPVSKDEVDRILGRIKEPEDGKETLEIPYKVGDSVQVMDGPFTDWVGVINEINHEKGKLKVMISIFGKDTPVELDFLQVKQS